MEIDTDCIASWKSNYQTITTNKNDRYDITEKLLEVALNPISQIFRLKGTNALLDIWLDIFFNLRLCYTCEQFTNEGQGTSEIYKYLQWTNY